MSKTCEKIQVFVWVIIHYYHQKEKKYTKVQLFMSYMVAKHQFEDVAEGLGCNY